jgi:low affinity Fe/Cu permease
MPQSEATNGSTHAGFSAGFRAFAERTETVLGSPWAFGAALAAVLLWAALGPRYHYSETWQIVINTGTTIVTFLMVFLLQNTQMRSSTALHLKIDELLRAVGEARTGLVGLENRPDETLKRVAREFDQIAKSQTDVVIPASSTRTQGA